MSVSSLVASGGRLDASPLRALASQGDECLSIITTLGAYGVHHREILDAIFDTSFTSAPSDAVISSAVVRGHDSAVIAEPPRNLCVLDVEPCDGPDPEREEIRQLAWNLSVSLADILLLVIRMRDLVRVHSNGLSALGAAITQTLMLRADSVVPTPSSKIACLVVVRDYESDVVQREDVVSGFLNEAQNLYAKIAKPPRSPSRITDFLEFEFVLLPDNTFDPAEATAAIDDLKDKLLDPTADEYFFEGSAFAHDMANSVADSAESVWNQMEKERTQETMPKKDLMSAFDCDNAMRKVFEKYETSVRVWKRETEGGVIIEKFGEHATEMVNNIIAVYDQDASPHKGGKAFKRKRDELKDLLDSDLYNLFVVQIAKLRDVTYRVFKQKLEQVDDSTPRLDKEVNTLLKESKKSFKTNADALRPGFSSWRYDNEEADLAAKMREDATDKLQRVRLADYQEGGGRQGRRRRAAIASAAPKRRQPISLGIHYLDPAPFGWKDSRYEKLNLDDQIEANRDVPIFAAGSSSNSAGGGGGLAVPLAPSRNSTWQRSNQDLIYSERK